MPYKVDTDKVVRFYEQEFYVLSNFSAFRMAWKGYDFDTSEIVYHWEKFRGNGIEPPEVISGKSRARFDLMHARSSHDAYKVAQDNKEFQIPNWNEIKVDVMRDILRAKVDQHPYVKKKLLETGDRLLIEDSWRDSYWGWGADEKGQNVLGRLWMEVRDEVRKKE